MLIAVNTRFLIKNNCDGISNFTFETLKRITNKHREHQFLFIFDRKFDKSFIFSDNIIPVVSIPQARHPFLWYLWFEYSIPRIFQKYKPDVFISPDGYLSLKSNVPTIPVIHDLNFWHRPEEMPYLIRKYYNKFFPLFAQKAVRIATVSEYSKQDIIKSFNINEQKIDVVHSGVREFFRPISDDEKHKTKNKYTNNSDFFIFIGSFVKRKNIANAIISFNKFKQEYCSNIKLILVGQKIFSTKELMSIYNSLEHKNDIIFLHNLSHQEVANLLASAIALLYPSFFEGFGVPLLEAMHCEIPIITSNTTSLPEIAGDTAILVNPNSVEEIKNAMIEIIVNKEKVKILLENAKSQKNKFSWDITAGKLWNSMEKTFEKL